MGIAHRKIRAKFDPKQAPEHGAKPLPVNIKTIGDWIYAGRVAKNLTSGHVALKMGIAHSLVRSWEDGTGVPDSPQMTILEKVLGTKPAFCGS